MLNVKINVSRVTSMIIFVQCVCKLYVFSVDHMYTSYWVWGGGGQVTLVSMGDTGTFLLAAGEMTKLQPGLLWFCVCVWGGGDGDLYQTWPSAKLIARLFLKAGWNLRIGTR